MFDDEILQEESKRNHPLGLILQRAQISFRRRSECMRGEFITHGPIEYKVKSESGVIDSNPKSFFKVTEQIVENEGSEVPGSSIISLRVSLADIQGKELQSLISINRDTFTCDCWYSEMNVLNLLNDNKILGTIRIPVIAISKLVQIVDSDCKVKYWIHGNCCLLSCFCPMVERNRTKETLYLVKDKMKRIAARIVRKDNKEKSPSDTNGYFLEFSDSVDQADKYLIIAATLMLDLYYYEEDSRYLNTFCLL
eukprot:TRINITY_DN15581_c0_g1_i1.p1 TRINITY_DN15581_c0_g1~~TRINITY_DN15581_c0_g1_i1.p1  ORF type:complete len:252 (-),score=25.06 TRINITY_DN15581_c0_g1_i1:135-890(-)